MGVVSISRVGERKEGQMVGSVQQQQGGIYHEPYRMNHKDFQFQTPIIPTCRFAVTFLLPISDLMEHACFARDFDLSE